MDEKRFFRELVRNPYFIAAVFFNLLEGILRIRLAVAGGSMVNLAGNGEQGAVIRTFLAAAMSCILIGFSVTAKEGSYVRALEAGIFRIKELLFDRLTAIPLLWLENVSPDELVSARLNDINTLSNALRPLVIMCFSLVVTRIETVLFLLLKNPFVTVMMLCASPGLLLLQNRLAKSVKMQKKEELAAAQAMLGEASGDFEAQEYIKSVGLEKFFSRRFAEKQDREVQALLKLRRMEAASGAMAYLSEWVPRLLLVTAGAWQISRGKMTAGDLVVFAVLSSAATRLFAGIADLKMKLEQARASLQRAIREEDKEKERKLMVGEEGEAAAFSHVTFGYRSADSVFSDVSFVVRQGEAVQFSGPSGCGKSTALKVLCGLYPPNGGDVRAAGAANLKELRNRIAYVPQTPFLFHGSLYENIACTGTGITRNQAEALLEKMGMGQWLKEQKEGIDTVVGERGILLSGGQRQRVAVARALAKNAGILVLDEATAGLDKESEEMVYEVVRNAMAARRELTVIIVTHQEVPIPGIREISFETLGKCTAEGRAYR